MRADARRNRDRLVEVAVGAFAAGGADVSLEAIARDAGVGIGTLYRHFPTREDLVEAVYRDRIAALCSSAGPVLASRGPVEGLREWSGRVIDELARERGIGAALPGIIGTSTPTAAALEEAVRTMLDAGVAAGLFRSDVGPDDVLKAIVAVSVVTADGADRGPAGRLLGLVVDGLRYGVL